MSFEVGDKVYLNDKFGCNCLFCTYLRNNGGIIKESSGTSSVVKTNRGREFFANKFLYKKDKTEQVIQENYNI